MILSHTQTQQQIMTTAMKQSLTVLQLPLAALRDHINDLALENPMLDPDSLHTEEFKLREDHSGRQFERERIVSQHTRDDAPLEALHETPVTETFISHLKGQLPQIARHLPEKYLPLCETIIESLDRRGYFNEALDLLALSMGVSVEDAMQALYAVQTLTPTGVGARSLEECLVLQLAESRDFNQYTLAIVREHLLLLARQDFKALSKALSIPVEEVRAYGQVIRSLNPIPSNGFSVGREDNHPVIPDAIVEWQRGELAVSYNRSALPRPAVSREYHTLLDTTTDPEVRDYLSKKLQQVEKLQQDLEKREDTLVRLIRHILTVQRDYVTGLSEALAPLSVQEIAGELELHPSTISRALKDKYITLHGQTIPLKNLLSTQIGKGIPVSRDMLRLYMGRLVDAEDKTHPLSDEHLAEALAIMNIHISRRTVAAYREEFGIPPVSRRRQRF